MIQEFPKAEPVFYIMRQNQAGQLLTPVSIDVEERAEPAPRHTASPAGPRPHCLRCTLATLMGLIIVGLVVGFVLHGLIYKSTCKQCLQDLGPPYDLKKVNTWRPNESMQKEEHDVFTAPKDASYLIHGQVMRLDLTSTGPIYLEHRWGETSDNIQIKDGSCSEVFFSAEVKLYKDSVVSLVFNDGQPNYRDICFHIYELVTSECK